MRIHAPAFIAACLGTFACHAPARGPVDVSGEIDRVLARHGIPALAGAIVTTDGLTGIGVAGDRASDRDDPVLPGDSFHLGSCTKAMTATLIAILVEDNLLTWDTTLEQALPDIAPEMHEGFKSVTVADLLVQRSGVPADMSANGVWAGLWAGRGSLVDQRRECARVMLAQPPSHDRSRFVYANANFILAGHIAEVAAGEPWEDLMRSRLFTPLGMTTAGFGAPGSAEHPDAPRGHRPDGTSAGFGRGADNPPALGPAGTVHASLEDWGKFVSFHLRGAKAAREGLGLDIGGVEIRPRTWSRLHTPVRGEGGDYAMGWRATERSWAQAPQGKPTVLTHAGSNTMWYCVVWAAPEAGFAVLSASNAATDAAQKACDEVSGMLIKAHRAARDQNAPPADR
ncbi:MAG: beta-lactamase family protein [Phycisphaeraceae bacterium]|nr:beta-lactamase family protein [Phycisphaerae bacterium]MBX3392819.1 beta-lactamase family protein [Phycisphaeraceae bacterium]